MHKTLKDKAVVFARPYVEQGLSRSKATQLPFKAHTSTNAKASIAASLFLSAIAVTGVAVLLMHGVAKHASTRYRTASDETLNKLSRKANEVVEDAKSVVDEKVAEAKTAASKTAKKTEETVDKASL